jgi:heme oxygenase
VRLLPEPTRERYVWFLGKLYGFHHPIETGWDSCPALDGELGADLAGRRRVPLLVRDLRALGIEPSRLRLCPSP